MFLEKLDQYRLGSDVRFGIVEAMKALTLEQLIELKIEADLDSPFVAQPRRLWAASLEAIERPLIRTMFRRVKENQVHLARALGLNRNTVRKKLLAFGLIGRAAA